MAQPWRSAEGRFLALTASFIGSILKVGKGSEPVGLIGLTLKVEPHVAKRRGWEGRQHLGARNIRHGSRPR